MNIVDEYCDAPGAKVYKKYSCILSQTNIAKNSNKFYVMQIIISGSDSWLYCRYGRIGDKGIISKTLHKPVWNAVQKFCSTFFAKTGNKWGELFKNKPNKYVQMNIEEPEIVTEKEDPGLDSTKLSVSIGGLIRMISNKQLMTKTLQKLNVDVKKMPLGKIKKNQLVEAEEILEVIGTYLSQDTIKNLSVFGHAQPEEFQKKRLVELSSQFWTLLPYSCGRNPPPIINTAEILRDCADKVDGVRSIEISTQIIERFPTPEKIYDSLNVSINVIDQASKEWSMLLDYVNASQGLTHDHTELVEAFSIEKSVRDKSSIFSSTGNHMLLFHGSRSANYVGIFSEGLRIPNVGQIANGSVLGAGVYFADCITKSFQYCHDTQGLILVCEVALGKEERLIHASSHALPQGYQSRMACGKHRPNPLGTREWQRDPNVLIPCGKIETIQQEPHARGYGFLYNEYVIYRKEQYRFRYLLKLNIKR